MGEIPGDLSGRGEPGMRQERDAPDHVFVVFGVTISQQWGSPQGARAEWQNHHRFRDLAQLRVRLLHQESVGQQFVR